MGNGSDTKKLILKTALLTVASVLCAVLLTFLTIFIFSPKTLASMFDNMGNYSVSIYFYKKQYNKTSNIEDLALLVEKLDIEKDYSLICAYAEKLINEENFINNYYEQDKDTDGATRAELYFNKYARAAYKNGGIDEALRICQKAVSKIGYTEYNAFRTLFTSFNLSKDENQKILDKLGFVYMDVEDQELEIIAEDEKYLESLLS